MPNITEWGSYQHFSELTDEIQFIPNKWGRIGELGIFEKQGTPNLSVTFDRVDGVLNALNARQRGVQPQYGSDEIIKTYSYATAYFPANDRVTPADVQGVRRAGSADGVTRVDEAVQKKLTNLRMAHAQTLEYMEMQALKGLVKSPDGTVFADLYTDFGFTQKVIDFDLGTASTQVDSKIRELIRHIEDNTFSGGSIGGIRILVSQEFFDKLITHDSVKEAYTYYQSNNQVNGSQVLRDDLRRDFRHQGVIFEEYRGSVTKMDGTVERMITADEGHAFSMGTTGIFETWFSPADHIAFANTVGEEVYSWSVPAPDGSSIEIYSQSAPLPICRKPQSLVKVETTT